MRICNNCKAELNDFDFICTACGSNDLSLIMPDKENAEEEQTESLNDTASSEPIVQESVDDDCAQTDEQLPELEDENGIGAFEYTGTGVGYEAPPVKRGLSIRTCIIITVVLVVLAAVACGYIYVDKYLPSEPVRQSQEGIISGDFQVYLDKVPEKLATVIESSVSQSYGSVDKYNQGVKDSLIETYGEKYKVKVSVLDVINVNAETLKTINKNCEQYDIEAQDAKFIIYKVVTSGNEQMNVTSDTTVAIKVDGKWYAS